MSKKNEMFRQGDILFRKVAVKSEKMMKAKDFIVARGEATGHSHRVVGGELWTDEHGQMIVESDGDTAIVHDEHARIDLPKGFFEVVRQREYVEPKVTRTVRD